MKQEFSIKGMSCNHCVERVEDAVHSLDGVKKIKVNLKKENGKTISEKINILAGLGERLCYPRSC